MPLLDVLQQLLHSRNSCICPEILPTNNIPRQARPVEQNINITYILQQQNSSRNSTNVPIIELFVLRKLWQTLLYRYFLYCAYPHAVAPQLYYIADNRQYFVGPIERHYSASMQVLILSQLWYPRILAVIQSISQSAGRLFYCCCIPKIPISTCWIDSFDPQLYQRRIYEDTHDW